MGKRAYLFKLLQDIRASYWFLPTVLVGFGLLLAVVMGWVDANPGVVPFDLPGSLLDTQADGARSTLAVIAQAIIGVTGVVFSMTLVAVSFASGNYGPRLIGNFMRDRGTQWSLGILIATFVYALTVLRTVQDGTDGDIVQFVPQFSILMALALTLLCVLTLIFFIHHVPEMINVSHIAANIGDGLNSQIKGLIARGQVAAQPPDLPDRDPDHQIMAAWPGYIQTVNFDQLSDLAGDHVALIRMTAPVGAFVTTRTVVFDIWCDDPPGDDTIKAIRACYALGPSRTENQNPSFLAEQLVEMVARAMSPGVNDPYTAMDCLNRLAAALTIASTNDGGLQPRLHKHVAYDSVSFDDLFAVTFPLCRQYIAPDRIVRTHAAGLLQDLLVVVRPQDRRVIIDEVADLNSAGGTKPDN